MQTFFVSKAGQQLGPWGLPEIVKQVRDSELSMTDYIFDQGANDWVLLADYAPVRDQLTDYKPKAPPKPVSEPQGQHSPTAPTKHVAVQAPHTDADMMAAEWYVLKGENKFGPFAFTEVVKMLQEKLVFEFDFAWSPGLATWKRVAELEAFNQEKIRKLKDTLMPNIQEVFFRRRYRRVQYGGTLVVHDNSSVWKGKGIEISAGGAGVVMENAMIVPGQTLYLHFKPGDGVPAFNAVCEVVSKQFVDNIKDKSTPVKYGLKFKSIAPDTQKLLMDFSKKGQAAA